MEFGDLAVDRAEGAVLAHSLALPDGRLKKGTVLTADHCASLAAAGHTTVMAARLGPGDVGEADAAQLLAEAVAGTGVTLSAPFTGRVNLLAEAAGIAEIDAGRVTRLNAVHESLTLATLPPLEIVSAGQMVATVKIIPFGVERTTLDEGLEQVSGAPLVGVMPFRSAETGLLITELPGDKPGLFDKTIDINRQRLARFGATVATVERCAHSRAAIAGALSDLAEQGCSPILVFSSSAVVDRGDVVPSGLVDAGGRIVHFGMPVDPGNLLLVGELGQATVLAAPGSARSPRPHGFDWALARVLAGLPLDSDVIAAMGVGGLLKEIPSRPQPRTGARRRPAAARRIAAVVLAGGRSSRMGADNKLLLEVDGAPMVAHAVRAAIGSKAVETVVVTGHEADAVRDALSGQPVRFAHNPDFADGLSTSLRAGIAALGPDVDGAVILLGDMPGVDAAHVDALINAFAPEDGRAVCVAASGGRRGNPVLWDKRFFAELQAVTGDTGARRLLRDHGDLVVEVPLTGAVLVDIDTPEALARARSEDPAGEGE